jgi:hypothetical protein
VETAGEPILPKPDTAPRIGLKQRAMVSTSQKPTQRNRIGEVPEALPGSTLERRIYEKKLQELERSS